MSHSLGIDLGTSFVAAAVARDHRAEMVPLGDASTVAHAAVHVGESGSFTSGDAAARRAVRDPERVAQGLKRRLGDSAPVVLGGVPFPVTELLGALLRTVLARVVEVSAGEPDTVVLTHPANWGPARCRAFADVAESAGLTRYSTVTEPEAAAAYHRATRHLENGQVFAVYDLGGGTFDATVLRCTPDGTEVLGVPDGVERLGGADLDDAVLAHVDAAVGGLLHRLDLSDARTVVALARLRQDCIVAKEALTFDTETTIPVFLPGRHLEVPLSRREFEELIRVPVESTLHALGRTLRTAGVAPGELSSVLLVGGSSQIPLIAEMVSREFDCPAVLDAHPKHAVALGAAIVGTERRTGVLTPRLRGAFPAPAASATERPDRPATTDSVVGSPPLEATSVPPSSVAPSSVAPSSVAPSSVTPSSVTPAPVADAPSASPPPAGVTTVGAATASDSRGDTGPADGEPKGPPALLAVAVLLLVALVGVAVLLSGVGPPSGQDDRGTPTAAAPQAERDTVPQVATFAPVAASVPVPSTVGTVPVGETPGYVVASPDGRRLYVAQRAAGTIAVVDTAVDQVVTTIEVPSGPPQYLTLSPDGTRAYVSVWDDDRTVAAISVLDTTTGEFGATVPMLSRPYVSAVSPDGSRLYVPNHDSAVLSVVDTRTATSLAEIEVPPNPHWVELTTDGTRAYVADHDSNVVAVVDTATDTVVDEVPVGTSPHSVAVHRSRPLVANVNFDAASVSVIDTGSDEVVATVPVGDGPQDVTWSADGRFAYVANVRDSTLSVVSAEDFTVTATIPTGTSPTSVAVLPDGSRAYVSDLDDGTLTVLDLTE